ncbi:hypothetical protein GCM10018965_087510 [Nonomuraea roseola]
MNTKWIGLAVLALPTLLISIDVFVLLLALPHLSAELGAGSTEQLWIMDIYGFMLAGFLITMGTLGDRIGRRRLLLIGATAFRLRDFLHKLTTRLVRENQTVVIEDLTVRAMVKNHSLARAISDASWRELRGMLTYKAAWYGRELVVVDRWFPSSKLCSACGTLQDKMPLGVRMWECACGVVHDRDVNAAKNILAVGLAER